MYTPEDKEFYGQWPQEITLDKVQHLLRPEVYQALSIPAQNVHYSTKEFKVHKAFTRSEVQKEVELTAYTDRQYDRLSDSVAFTVAKEQQILFAVVELCEKVYAYYKEVSDKFGVPLTSPHYLQLINKPIMYIDLMPGDTAILFDVFTTRDLLFTEATFRRIE